MYTANTMASAIEALGLSLPNSSAPGRDLRDKQARLPSARRGGGATWSSRNLRPRDILTRKAFENAITTVIALGGSTNAVLHLLAIAHAADVKLSLDDFTRIGKRVPVLADLKPSGRYVMAELVRIGGIDPADEATARSRPAARRRDDGDRPDPGGEPEGRGGLPAGTAGGRSDFDTPIKKDSHLVILRGNLAPDGAVAKISGKEGERFTGAARVFDREERALAAILAGRIKKGDVVVIRYEGPRGGPGMREMLSPTSAIMGRGLGNERGAHHRRPVQRRHPRLRGRPHHAGGGARRAAGAREERRSHHHRRRRPAGVTRDAGP